MKKIYLALVMLIAGVSAQAQRTIKIDVDVVSPADGSTIAISAPFDELVVIKNIGPDVIDAADTILFQDPVTLSAPSGSPTYVLLAGYSKAVGDTIQLRRSGLTYSGSGGTISFCAAAVVFNDTEPVTFDTTGGTWNVCNSITLTDGTGIGENILKENVASQQLSIAPNPASTTVRFDYIAKGSSEVVAQVYDVTGRTIMSHSYGKSYNGQKGFSLDISTLNTGMYFVELRQDGVRAVGKLNKQ